MVSDETSKAYEDGKKALHVFKAHILVYADQGVSQATTRAWLENLLNEIPDIKAEVKA